HLNIVPPREHTFPPRENTGTRPRTDDDDQFAPSKRGTRANDAFDDGSAVPPRSGTGTGTRRGTSGGTTDDESFSRPSIRNPTHGTKTDEEKDLFPANPPPRSNPDGAASRWLDTFKVK